MSAMRGEEFDIQALYEAMNERREARSMTWADVAREINAWLPAPSSISASTISRGRDRRSLEADGVLQMLRWLNRTPEAFCRGVGCTEKLSSQLPGLGPGWVLRFDSRAIFAALQVERSTQQMTWEQAADAIGGVSAANLKRLEAGGRVSFPQVMRLVRWLHRPASKFMQLSTW